MFNMSSKRYRGETNIHLRGYDTRCRCFRHFQKSDNCCDLLFAFLSNKLLLERVYSKRKVVALFVTSLHFCTQGPSDNCCDLLFAFLSNKPLLERVYSKRKVVALFVTSLHFCTQGPSEKVSTTKGKNLLSFDSKLFCFREHPFSEGGAKSILLPPKVYPSSKLFPCEVNPVLGKYFGPTSKSIFHAKLSWAWDFPCW